MKTSYLSVLLAALALSGCSQNEITEMSPEANPAVGFSVFTGTQTKGLVTDNGEANSSTTASIKDKSFGVLAYYTGTADFSTATNPVPNFMWNQKIEWDASLNSSQGAWKYTPLKYWPNTVGEKVSFFAYAPYAGTQSTSSSSDGIELTGKTATGYPKITFHWNTTTPSSVVDLVATDATQANNDKTIDLTKQTAVIPFKFKHALSRASFYAKLSEATVESVTKVFIKDVQLLGKSVTTPAAENTASKFYTKATYKFEDGKWDTTTGGAFTQQETAVSLDNALFNKSAQTFGTTVYTETSFAVSTTEPAKMFKENQYLFLIPPTDEGIAASTDMRVLLTYDVVTLDTNLDGGSSVIETKAVVSLPDGTLKAGSAYKYIFTIGLEGVQITADVTAWENADESVVTNVPSVVAASFDAAGIAAAIGTLNTLKTTNPNCNYFVIAAPTSTIASATTIDLSASGVTVTDTNFKIGDRIELNLSKISDMSITNTVTVTPSTNWTASAAVSANTSSIILTKNK